MTTSPTFASTTNSMHLLFTTTISFLILAHQGAHASSDPTEVAALLAIKNAIGDDLKRLSNWVGDNPCGMPHWKGVYCEEADADGVQHVLELRLLNMNFTGTLAPEVGNLKNLKILNFMWNNIRGHIPPEIGKLSKLHLLLFDGNGFTGSLPPELGNLSELNRLQIDINNLTGLVPPSFQGLSSVKHIHLNNNSLSGSIPRELGQLPHLLHLLLDNNNMSGELPSELSNISTLVILQLDNNNFDGSIPLSYSRMTNLSKLSLRNCNLSGIVPNFTASPTLAYLDLSHNRLSGSLPSFMSSASESFTTIDLSFNNLEGELPSDYLTMDNMDFLMLQNNSLDGTIAANSMTHNPFNSPGSVMIVDLQNNNFSTYKGGGYSSLPNVTFRIYGNPVCSDASVNASHDLCLQNNGSIYNHSTVSVDTPVLADCSCDSTRNQYPIPGQLARGQCRCAYPLEVGYRLKSPSFATFAPYEDAFDTYIATGLHLQDYQVHVVEYGWQPGPRLRMTLKLFPNSSEFDPTEVEYLYSMFTNWSIPPNNTFGPYELLSFTIGYPYADGSGTNENSLSGGAIAGIVVAAVALTTIVVAAAMFLVGKHLHCALLLRPERRLDERIKIAGVKSFSFEDMTRATNNFEASMQVGQGGYGRVYRGVLADELVVAIKRTEVGSLRGSKEFYTEIELLSRVHHRNLVSLIGYCEDKGEQMLVYEFMVNGTLRDHLINGSKAALDFPARLQIALGSAKGILYLHTEANPPIFHRDIKSTNILLDERRRAKVADFGISKLAPVADLEGDAGGYISSVVQGTPGYLDPEYLCTRILTDKSDVYSFGVVLLELVTGLQPIYRGKSLIKEVTLANEGGRVLSMVDSRMGTYPTRCMVSLVELALSCCNKELQARPSMAEVATILVTIWQSTPSSADASMASLEASNDMEAVHLTLQQPSSSSTPYISSNDIEEGGLFRGSVLQLTPR